MEAQRARSPNHMDHIGSPSSSSSSSSPSPRVTHAHWNPASGLRISIHACHVRLHDCRPRRRRHLAVGALQRHGLTFDFLDDNTFLIISTLWRDHRPADREVRLRPCIVAHRRRAIQRRRTERGLSLGGLDSLDFRLFLFFFVKSISPRSYTSFGKSGRPSFASSEASSARYSSVMPVTESNVLRLGSTFPNVHTAQCEHGWGISVVECVMSRAGPRASLPPSPSSSASSSSLSSSSSSPVCPIWRCATARACA